MACTGTLFLLLTSEVPCVCLAWVRAGPRIRRDEQEHTSRGKECKVIDYWNPVWRICQRIGNHLVPKSYWGPLNMPWQKIWQNLWNGGGARSRKFFPCKSQCTQHPPLVPFSFPPSTLSGERRSSVLFGTICPWGCRHAWGLRSSLGQEGGRQFLENLKGPKYGSIARLKNKKDAIKSRGDEKRPKTLEGESWRPTGIEPNSGSDRQLGRHLGVNFGRYVWWGSRGKGVLDFLHYPGRGQKPSQSPRCLTQKQKQLAAFKVKNYKPLALMYTIS